MKWLLAAIWREGSVGVLAMLAVLLPLMAAGQGTPNDTLRGGTGDDRLMAEEGTDVCDGGVHVQGDTAQSCERITGVP